jgi:hypothetical protein
MNPIPVISSLASVDPDFAHSHSVIDALPHLGGMLMVLLTLACLWALTAIVANIISIYQKIQPATPPAAAKPDNIVPAVAAPAVQVEPIAPAEPVHKGVSPEIVAIISAAIACLGGGKRRVISIKPADTSWEKSGRQAVLMSHRIR